MYFDRPALKAEARRAMRTTRPRPMLVTLLYLLLTTGLSTLISIIITVPMTLFAELTDQGLNPGSALLVTLRDIGPIGLFLHLLVALFGVVLSFGYSQWALSASRGEKASFSDLVSGFSMVGKVLWLSILLLLCELLLRIFFAMAAQLAMLPFLWIPVLNYVAAIVFPSAATLIPSLLMLWYTMSAYCLLDDPESGAFLAMRRSRQLMRGHIGDLILLYLSFVGWFLLAVALTVVAVLCFGIPIGYAMSTPDAGTTAFIYCIIPAAVSLLSLLLLGLWLIPYLTISECKFYDRLPRTQSDAPPFDL